MINFAKDQHGAYGLGPGRAAFGWRANENIVGSMFEVFPPACIGDGAKIVSCFVQDVSGHSGIPFYYAPMEPGWNASLAHFFGFGEL